MEPVKPKTVLNVTQQNTLLALTTRQGKVVSVYLHVDIKANQLAIIYNLTFSLVIAIDGDIQTGLLEEAIYLSYYVPPKKEKDKPPPEPNTRAYQALQLHALRDDPLQKTRTPAQRLELYRQELGQDLFFIQTIKPYAISPSSPDYGRLASRKRWYWRLTFENHYYARQIMDRFRYPLKVMGQEYTVAVLEADSSHRVSFVNGKQSLPSYTYILGQGPHFGAKDDAFDWTFEGEPLKLRRAIVKRATVEHQTPARLTSLADLMTEAHCNPGRVASNVFEFKLDALPSCTALLLDYTKMTSSLIKVHKALPKVDLPHKKVAKDTTTNEQNTRSSRPKECLGKRMRQTELVFDPQKKVKNL